MKTVSEKHEVNNVKICPVCKREYTEHSAISRKDKKTEICSDCGMEEAFKDLYNIN